MTSKEDKDEELTPEQKKQKDKEEEIKEKVYKEVRKPRNTQDQQTVMMDTGRILGNIKLTDPSTYKLLEQYADARGIKVHEALIMMVQNFFFTKREVLSEMKVLDLYSAWDIIREMQGELTKQWISAFRMFIGEQQQAFADLVDVAVERRLSISQPQKGTPTPQQQERMGKLLEPIVNMISAYMNGIFSQMFKQQLPTGQTFKIPVEIREEIEKEIAI